MDEEDRQLLRQLKAERDIYQCLVRYCRGIDRGDRELMMSAYHPDAYDQHGVFNGPAQDLVDWAVSSHLAQLEYHNHYITNIQIEVDGDRAVVETYVRADLRFRRNGKLYDLRGGGRYLDRFECRDGQWKIAHRLMVGDRSRVDPVLVYEDAADLLADGDMTSALVSGSRDKDDPSYQYFSSPGQ